MKLDHVGLSFGEKVILRDFSLEIAPGESLCITGASGRGKTTLLNLMLGFISPQKGAVLGFDAERKGVVFQEDRLIEHWNAVRNVLLAADSHVSRKDALQGLRRVALEPDDTPVRKLSGGQRRRVAIVRAVLARPTLLLLDEPFKGLDQQALKKSASFIREEAAGAAIVLCAHSLEEARLLGIERIVSL